MPHHTHYRQTYVEPKGYGVLRYMACGTTIAGRYTRDHTEVTCPGCLLVVEAELAAEVEQALSDPVCTCGHGRVTHDVYEDPVIQGWCHVTTCNCRAWQPVQGAP